jgi:phosphatidylglycerol---prolipoprotein diacylglyceryl transferase
MATLGLRPFSTGKNPCHTKVRCGKVCCEVDPIAFKIGGLTIHWYGVLVALGFLIGLWLASRRGLRSGISPERIMDIGPWLIVGTIVGARTLHVISYWDEEFAGKPLREIFMVQKGGLVYYGGLIGATLGGIIYLLWKKLPLWKFADALTPSIAFGYVLGRIGCLMNGCCYGRPCDMPWAIRFPAEHATRGVPVHPTQIYDSLLSLLFWGLLEWLYRRKRFDGQIFATYLIGYAFLRSFVEFFRGDYTTHYLGGWATPAHLVSIVTLATGLILLWQLSRRAPTAPRVARSPST